MRFEIILIFITGLLIFNVYTDGKYIQQLMSYKKYYQMAGIAFGGFVLYWLLKKNPKGAHEMIRTSNDLLKYLPVDRNTTGLISPILDFTSKQAVLQSGVYGGGSSIDKISNSGLPPPGSTKSKRSVSETKKKFVASRQNWTCGDCQEQLSAWFEVDHKIRLEYGGSNHIDNLVALCRDCHGRKTTIENL